MIGGTSESGIELLKRVAALQPADPDLAALADRVRDYLARAASGVSLDEACGVATAANAEPWYLRESRDRRNAELRALVARFGAPGASVRARALWLQLLIERYRAVNWLRDRAADRMPQHYRSTEKEYLFRAFTACMPPSGERQLRAILSDPLDRENWQVSARSDCQL